MELSALLLRGTGIPFGFWQYGCLLVIFARFVNALYFFTFSRIFWYGHAVNIASDLNPWKWTGGYRWWKGEWLQNSFFLENSNNNKNSLFHIFTLYLKESRKCLEVRDMHLCLIRVLCSRTRLGLWEEAELELTKQEKQSRPWKQTRCTVSF